MTTMRATHPLRCLLLAGAALFMAAPVFAQSPIGGAGEPARRHGVHFSVGAGASSVSATCAGCQIDLVKDRITGFSGVLQLGGYVTPRLAIAGEFSGWIKNDDLLDRRIASASLVMLAYPSARAGFFLKSGIGGMRAVIENDAGFLQTTAFASQLGLGYDIPLGAISLTPYANMIWTFGGETNFSGVGLPETVSPNALQVGLAFSVP
jgi:hypothetical protein